MKKLLLTAVSVVLFFSARARASEFDDYVGQIETCEAVLQEFMANRDTAIPPEVWSRARAVVIVNQLRAGFLFGVKAGWGVVLAKKPNGQWSLPVMVKAGEASFGLQVGGAKVESVLIITNDETVKMLYRNRFNIGVDAKAVGGPKWREVETVNRDLLDAPVLVYTKNKGLFAGATVKTGYLVRDDEGNRRFYNTFYSMPELLYGDFVQPIPEVQPLMALVSSYSH
jgi:SH3 domain-containing YSC84-like protein 1